MTLLLSYAVVDALCQQKGAERSTTADETKRTDRSDRAKDRGGKRLIIKTQRAMPDADETSAEEPHSDPQQPHGTGVNEDVAATASAPELHRPFGMSGSLKNNDANTDNINGNRFKKEGVKPNGLRICMKEAWATIVDSDVSIEVLSINALEYVAEIPMVFIIKYHSHDTPNVRRWQQTACWLSNHRHPHPLMATSYNSTRSFQRRTFTCSLPFLPC